MRKYICGTPKKYCGGQEIHSNNGPVKVHATSPEAFKCHRKYLIDVEGFIPMDSLRELASPNDGPIRLLPKQSHFGIAIRGGKKGDKDGSQVKNRGVPYNNGKRCSKVGGYIG